jgi:hypothetical protein
MKFIQIFLLLLPFSLSCNTALAQVSNDMDSSAILITDDSQFYVFFKGQKISDPAKKPCMSFCIAVI